MSKPRTRNRFAVSWMLWRRGVPLWYCVKRPFQKKSRVSVSSAYNPET